MTAPAATFWNITGRHEDLRKWHRQRHAPLTTVGRLTNRVNVTRAIVRGYTVHEDLQVGGRTSA
eukprot:5325988-Amphidinium_carterae.3